MRRLDQAAGELNSNPGLDLYLVGFNDINRPKRQALTRLKKSKNYLIKTYRISAKRINTLYGGTQDGLVLQIRLVDRKPVSNQ